MTLVPAGLPGKAPYRNGLPERVNYVYDGKGYDQLTASMDRNGDSVPRRGAKVHLDQGGENPRCGTGTMVTPDLSAVTCLFCKSLAAGTHRPRGRQA